MIDMDEIQFFTAEDYVAEIQKNHAAVRDLLNDTELLLESLVNNRNMTADEVAEYLRCSTGQIPPNIPRVHMGRRYLFKKSDVDKFIRDNKRILKKEPALF